MHEYMQVDIRHYKKKKKGLDPNNSFDIVESIESSIRSACFALRSLIDDVSLYQLKTIRIYLIESKLTCSVTREQ